MREAGAYSTAVVIGFIGSYGAGRRRRAFVIALSPYCSTSNRPQHPGLTSVFLLFLLLGGLESRKFRSLPASWKVSSKANALHQGESDRRHGQQESPPPAWRSGVRELKHKDEGRSGKCPGRRATARWQPGHSLSLRPISPLRRHKEPIRRFGIRYGTETVRFACWVQRSSAWCPLRHICPGQLRGGVGSTHSNDDTKRRFPAVDSRMPFSRFKATDSMQTGENGNV